MASHRLLEVNEFNINETKFHKNLKKNSTILGICS